ncbi:hypothetical protein PSPO01_03538 [Paraphaeosphaeria sporulosa]
MYTLPPAVAYESRSLQTVLSTKLKYRDRRLRSKKLDQGPLSEREVCQTIVLTRNKLKGVFNDVRPSPRTSARPHSGGSQTYTSTATASCQGAANALAHKYTFENTRCFDIGDIDTACINFKQVDRNKLMMNLARNGVDILTKKDDHSLAGLLCLRLEVFANLHQDWVNNLTERYQGKQGGNVLRREPPSRVKTSVILMGTVQRLLDEAEANVAAESQEPDTVLLLRVHGKVRAP